ncbi:hypothetical protein [Thalassiella azotivora]
MSGHHPTRAHASRHVDPRQTSEAPAVGPAPARGPSAGAVVLSLLAAVVAGAVVGALLALGGGGDEEPGGASTPRTEQTAAASEPIEPESVESFDPVPDGSGFRDDGGTWRTQRYNTADFGRLKPGVGLVLDLGEPRQVSEVTIPMSSSGLEVALLGGDEPPSGEPDDWTTAAEATTGDGPTVLSGADAGAHRYWMIWVTELAPTEGGFSATLAPPTVEGPPAG